jgi:hypothetical protein
MVISVKCAVSPKARSYSEYLQRDVNGSVFAAEVFGDMSDRTAVHDNAAAASSNRHRRVGNENPRC